SRVSRENIASAQDRATLQGVFAADNGTTPHKARGVKLRSSRPGERANAGRPLGMIDSQEGRMALPAPGQTADAVRMSRNFFGRQVPPYLLDLGSEDPFPREVAPRVTGAHEGGVPACRTWQGGSKIGGDASPVGAPLLGDRPPKRVPSGSPHARHSRGAPAPLSRFSNATQIWHRGLRDRSCARFLGCWAAAGSRAHADRLTAGLLCSIAL